MLRAASSSSADMRRIFIELKELQASPQVGITVTPRSEDATKLCVKMECQEGVYAGLPLHLGMELTNFPLGSPVVTMDTLITHPNVFSRSFICCDLLKGHLFTDSHGRISGYSPAYSLTTVLIQLMSFFSATNIEQDWEGMYTNTAGNAERLRAIENIKAFRCKHCSYNGPELASKCNKQFGVVGMGSAPVSVTVVENEAALQTRVMGLGGGMTFDVMPNELLLEIADHMAVSDIIKLGRAVPRFGDLVTKHNLSIRRDQRCFIYKTSIKEAVLGVGVWVASTGRNRDMKPVDFDLLSYDAFLNAGIRQTIWGQGFTHFLPLALTPAHFSKALPILQQSIVHLDCNKSGGFSPEVALAILSKLMNLMVVDLMKAMDNSSSDSHMSFYDEAPQKTKLIASEKALTGYSQLLHLLLSFANIYPELVVSAENKLSNFIKNKDTRGKDRVPNIGEFLVLLFLQNKHTCSELALPVFREVSARNVVWMLDPKHGNKPYLAFIEPQATSDFRLNETYTAQQTSLRLLMFQVLFMRRVGLGEKTPTELLAELNSRFGYPRLGLAEQLVQDIKGIYAVKTFNAFLPLVGIPLPTKEYFTQFLKDSINLSRQKGYHQCSLTERQLFTLRANAERGFIAPGFERGVQPKVESFFPNTFYKR
ncbi:hypothetical protein HDU79_001370 [Rhizoclosmatium sp. JEL0117]|nr:hypothetical protein HDU79_001370 [Rhizoclosmatium sp. JEL0117]